MGSSQEKKENTVVNKVTILICIIVCSFRGGEKSGFRFSGLSTSGNVEVI